MRLGPQGYIGGSLILLVICSSSRLALAAEDSASNQNKQPAATSVPEELKVEEPGMQAIPVPADPELEHQIKEVQDGLRTIYQQMVRRKEALKTAQDPAAKAALYDEFERLRRDREELEALLHDLVDEAKLSQRTAIDEALARARWFEHQQESWEKKEDLIRDRQQ